MSKIIYFIIISAVIIFIVSKTLPKKKPRQVNKNINNINNNVSKLLKINNVYNNTDIDGVCSYDTRPESMILNAHPIDGGHQIKHNVGDNFRYLSTDYGCKKPVKSIKQFHKDFFNFRDSHTNDNTSIRYDPVDKMADIRLDGGMDRMDGEKSKLFSGSVKIKDIYDNLVAGPPEYNKKYNSIGFGAV